MTERRLRSLGMAERRLRSLAMTASYIGMG
jgi:hypothetical protein